MKKTTAIATISSENFSAGTTMRGDDFCQRRSRHGPADGLHPGQTDGEQGVATMPAGSSPAAR
jgi:hypothetical protein